MSIENKQYTPPSDLEYEFSEMVLRLSKPGTVILQTLNPWKVDLYHMANAAVGEAAELADAVKKHVVYNKPLDRANIIEELGDLEFYIEGVRQNLAITRAETLTANLNKLVKGPNARYKNGYTDIAAQTRDDKPQGD